jgi:hypothetical protein
MPGTLTGADRLLRNLRYLATRLPNEVARAGYEEMEIEMSEMKARTPVDTGALRSTGFVNPPEVNGRQIEIVLGFGGPAIGYAIVQHENEDYFHKVGQDHFVSSVLDEGRSHYASRIARRVNVERLVT